MEESGGVGRGLGLSQGLQLPSPDTRSCLSLGHVSAPWAPCFSPLAGPGQVGVHGAPAPHQTPPEGALHSHPHREASRGRPGLACLTKAAYSLCSWGTVPPGQLCVAAAAAAAQQACVGRPPFADPLHGAVYLPTCQVFAKTKILQSMASPGLGVPLAFPPWGWGVSSSPRGWLRRPPL